MKSASRRKTIAIIASGLMALALAGSASLYYFRLRPVTLTVLAPWPEDAGIHLLRREAEGFRQRHPNVQVYFQSVDMGSLNEAWNKGWGEAIPSLAFGSTDPVNPEQTFLQTPHHWTGQVWALYYNKKVLSGLWPEGPPERFANGSIRLDEFEALLQTLAEDGIIPVSVGYRYTWPLAAWIQHLAMAEGRADPGPPPASTEDNPSTPGQTGQAWQAALERWTRWEKAGWVAPQAFLEDWPMATSRIGQGEAAFSLVTPNLATSISPEFRRNVGILPFPRDGGPACTVGSTWYLGIPKTTAEPGLVRALLAFLTSPAVSDRMQTGLNQAFYASGRIEAGTLAPSVTSDVQSGFMLYLGEFARSVKER
jgi:ABC-type glycerol-3-phosphate transport system substrate-binding protein